MAFAASAARTWPTFQHVQRSDNFTGAGMVLFLTPRQIVALETPYRRLRTGSLIKLEFGKLSKFTNASGIG